MRITEISCIIKEGIKEQSVSEDRQVTELKKFFNVNGSCNPQIHYIEYSNAIVHAFQRFRAPFSGKIVHIFPEQSAVI